MTDRDASALQESWVEWTEKVMHTTTLFITTSPVTTHHQWKELISTVLCQMAPSNIFWHFHFFTDYDITSNYTPPVKFLAATCTSSWCSWCLNIVLKGS